MAKKRKYGKISRDGLEIEDYVLTATEKEAARMERPLEKRGLDTLWWFSVACIVLLGARVVYLTAIKGSHYREVAKGNSVRSVVIKAPRGRIFDRSGIALVNNVPSIDAVIIGADLPDGSGERKSMAVVVAEVLGMNEGDVWARLENADGKSSLPVLLKENISQDEYLILAEQKSKLPGIGIEKTAIRQYMDSTIFSHILGYEGKIEKKELEENKGYRMTDYIGKQGLEKSYEKYLKGEDGAEQVEVDSMGNPQRDVGVIHPKAGADLTLSIDAGLQKKLYDSTSAILENTSTRTAAAVAINPKNGEVLALVNLPSYDNNLFTQKIAREDYVKLINDPDLPLFNRAIAGEYPPGSTIKPIISAAALSEGIIASSTVIDGLGGALRIGGFSFRDWKVHGPSDVRTAIAESNDIFFYTIGGGYGNTEGLGMSRMKKYYNLFGLGSTTGIDIGGEASGFIPDEQWKQDKLGEKWYIGNSYHASIGQGYVTSTPLQVALFTAAVANGGTLYVPHVVQQIKTEHGGVQYVSPSVVRSNIVQPDILKVLQEGMRKTVTDGTAQTLKNMSVEVAGKTGTAQFGSEDKTHAWFISYAPYDDPQIAMAVLVEGGGEGHSSAVPITKEVYEWYFGERQ